MHKVGFLDFNRSESSCSLQIDVELVAQREGSQKLHRRPQYKFTIDTESVLLFAVQKSENLKIDLKDREVRTHFLWDLLV